MAMEISSAMSAYGNYQSSYNPNKTNEKKDISVEDQQAVNTNNYLKDLQDKNPQLNIRSGKVNKNYRGGQYPSKVDVMIAPNILAKMAQDSEAANKYGKMLADIPVCEKWANSMIKSMTGNEVKYRQVWIDENGNMGSFSISGPSETQQKKDADIKIEKRKLEEKRQAKKEEKERLEKIVGERKEKMYTVTGNDIVEITSKMIELISGKANVSLFDMKA